MIKDIKIADSATLTEIIYRFGTNIETADGNDYYEIPFWFKPTTEGWVLYGADIPEDLKEFICKSGLGENNPQPQKVKL